jgi:DNA-binding transcriptional LysR family regulator
MPQKLLHHDWLASFAVFAEELSFTRAAARLHLTQPALHVQVAKLGEQVGAALYERHGRALVLTAAGEATLAFARRQAEAHAEFFAAREGKPSARAFVLAAGEGALLYVLDDWLRELGRRKDVKLSVIVRDREGTLAAVRRGEAHLGVTTLDAPPADLAVSHLLTAEMVLALPARHRLAGKARVRLADLASERLVLPPGDRPHRALVERALGGVGVAPDVVVEASGWPLMLHMVALGLGIAVVNGVCRLPRGVVGKPVSELPAVRYFRVERRAG